jgi:hypothetical protein
MCFASALRCRMVDATIFRMKFQRSYCELPHFAVFATTRQGIARCALQPSGSRRLRGQTLQFGDRQIIEARRMGRCPNDWSLQARTGRFWLRANRSDSAWRKYVPTASPGRHVCANLRREQIERSTFGSLLKKAADKDGCADMVVAMCRTETMTGQTVVIDSGRLFH